MNKVLLPYTTLVSAYKEHNKNMKYLDNDSNLSIRNANREFDTIPCEQLDDFFANHVKEYAYHKLNSVYVVVGITDDKLDDVLNEGKLID